MAPKSKGRVVDPTTFLPEDDIANLAVEHPYDGRSARRFNDRYGTYGIGGEDGGRRERRRDDEDTSRADLDTAWRRSGPLPPRADSRPMGGAGGMGMRREGGDYGSGGFRPRNPPAGNDIEINRSSLSRTDMSRAAPRPAYGGGSTETRSSYGFAGGDRSRLDRNRSQEEPEGDWRSAAKPPAATSTIPPPTAPSGGAAGKKRFAFLNSYSQSGTAPTAVKKEVDPPAAQQPTKQTDSSASPDEEEATTETPAAPPRREIIPQDSLPPRASSREVVQPSETHEQPPMRSQPPTTQPEVAAKSDLSKLKAVETDEAKPESDKKDTKPEMSTPPPVQTGPPAKPKRNLDSIWEAPRQPRPAARADVSVAPPVPRTRPAASLRPAASSAAQQPSSSVANDEAEEPVVEKKKKRVNEKKAALREARAKKVDSEGRKARGEVVRRNLIRGCAQDVDSVCSALDPIISGDEPLDVKSAGAELDRIVGSLEKTDTVWESTLLLACVHVVIVMEIASVAEDLMALEGWIEYTPAQLEAAVDEKLVPEAEVCVRNATPVLLAARERMKDFLGDDFAYVNLQEIMKSVAKCGCPRLTASLTITELVLIAWLTQSPELVTPELIVEWSDDMEDDTEGRATALAQMVHLVRWLQGGMPEEKLSDAEEAAEEESDED